MEIVEIINALPATFALSTVAFVVCITQVVKMVGWVKDNNLALIAVLTGAIVNPLINGEAFAVPFEVQPLVLSVLTGILIGAITAGGVNFTNQTAKKISGKK